MGSCISSGYPSIQRAPAWKGACSDPRECADEAVFHSLDKSFVDSPPTLWCRSHANRVPPSSLGAAVTPQWALGLPAEASAERAGKRVDRKFVVLTRQPLVVDSVAAGCP